MSAKSPTEALKRRYQGVHSGEPTPEPPAPKTDAERLAELEELLEPGERVNWLRPSVIAQMKEGRRHMRQQHAGPEAAFETGYREAGGGR